MNNLLILIPIHKECLSEIENFSLKYSLSKLNLNRHIRFIAPDSLNISFYIKNFKNIEIDFFDDYFFKSTQTYSELLLSKFFYQYYLDFNYLLILQTDSIIFYDNLNYWCSLGFDYVGAPWPDGHIVNLNMGQFVEPQSLLIKPSVGNGGFSLRKTASIINLLDSFQAELIHYIKYGFNKINGHNEDLFIASMGLIKNDFDIPDPITASKFSVEFPPQHYLKLNGNHPPMAAHAWWKYDIDFFISLINNPNLNKFIIK
jgi:hypothetical protein